jgi:MFS family permease
VEIGPIAGVIADRIDRRVILLWTTAAAVIASAVMAVLAITGVIEFWHVIVLALISGIAQSGTVPARQAMLPNLVKKEHLLNAVALSSIAQHGSRILGPIFGAPLLAFFGAGYVFALSTVLLMLGVIGVWMIRYRQEPAARKTTEQGVVASVRSIGRDLKEGVAYVERDRRVAIVMVLVMVHCGLTMAFDSMMPTLSTIVGGASTLYSAIIVGIGVGAVIGTFALSLVRTPTATGRALAWAGFGSGAAMLVLGVATMPVLVIAGAVLAGATQATYMAFSSALIQQIVPDELRGRVMSLFIMMATSHMAFLNFGFGWAADGVGVRTLLIIPALLWTAFFLAAALGIGEVRHMLRTGTFRSVAPTATATAAAGGSGGSGA